ncbi:LamG-like jellyroll fold domain-containing protein, partial [Parasediminibacterium paludis]
RAVVNSCSNTVYTNIYTVNAITGTAPVGGTVSSASYCGGSNNGSLSLTGATGNVSKWQYSIDGGVVWTDISNTTTTLSYTGITATTRYRAILTNGACGTAISAVGIITVNPASVAGTATGTAAVCAGTNSTTLSLSGYTGTIQWQSSTDNNTFISIAGATNSTYIAANLSTTTYYKAVVTNASCTAAISNTVVVTIKQPSTSITTASICAGGSYSFNGTNYTTAGTYVVHKTNAVGCDSAATLVLTVNPLPPTPNITLSGATTFCAGGSVTLTSDAASSYTWTGAVATTQAITVTTSGNYSVTISDGTCTATSAPVTVTVNSLPTVGGITQAGQFGNGLNFDGVNDYVNLTRTIQDDFTIEFWMKTTQIGNNSSMWYGGMGIVDAEYPGVTNDFGVSLVGNKIAFGVGNPDYTIFSTSAVNTGNWVHVAATRNKSTGLMQLYINGVLESSYTQSNHNSLNVPSYIYLGRDNNGTYFNGTLDEVRLWNTVRTSQDINTNMNGEIAGAPSGLVNYYKFNQGIANGNNTAITILSDAVGSNSKSLLNFALTGATSNFVAGAASTNAAALGNVCVGSTLQLSNATAGGVWTSSNTSVATVSTAGLVTGVTSGTAVISYAVTNASGCTTVVTTNITVNDNPVVSAITGNTTICVGSTTALADATLGGVWSSASTSIATVNTIGVVTGVGSGTTNINYAVTNASGCTTTVNTTLTINALPTVGAISGTSAVCVGKTVTYTNATTGGVWASLNASVASVDANGVVTGITAGTTNISYTVTNSNGCVTTVTKSITVNALPVVTISASGSTTLCLGGSVTLTASAGSSYAWSNGATTIAITVNTAGDYNVVVTNANGCSAASANTTVIVNSPSSSTTVIKVPFGGSYLFNGVTYNATGIYTAHLVNAVGCDSIATLN